MTIANTRGYWSTNIGNSFFQICSEGILNEINANSFALPDAPGYINVRRGNPKNFFDFTEILDVDFVCIHGPFFRREFDKIYLNSLKKLSKRGVGIIGLGVGAMHYDKKSISYYEKWIKEIDFKLISTRDIETFNFLESFRLPFPVHNGVDLGFLLRFYCPQPKFLNNKKLICFNFDQIPEPTLIENNSGPITIDKKTYSFSKHLSQEPNLFLKKIFPYFRPYFKTFKSKNLAGYEIIRLDHRFNPYSRKKIYSDSNTFAMDTPEGYLLAYANSKLTLSNRVHANVATLSYGNSSMYFSNSKRAKLLDRLGLKDIYKKPMSLKKEILEEEKHNLINFILKNL